MLIRVNKKISSQQSVKYAVLASGTVSAVWYDEESNASPKRRNRIQLMRAVSESTYEKFDA